MLLEKYLGNIRGIRLSRNFGKEAVLCAGISEVTAKKCVVMDSDLQHPPEMIVKMLEKSNEGFDIVECVKINRGCDLLLFSQKKNLLSFVTVLTIINLVRFAFMQNDLFQALSPFVTALVLNTIIAYVAIMIYVSVYFLKQKGNPMPLIATVLGFGSFSMLLISPVSGPNVLISFIFMAVLFCTTTITYITLPSKFIFLISMAIFLGSCVNLGYILKSFKNNYPMYKHNIVLINEYKTSLKPSKEAILVQKQLPDPIIGWSMPYMNKFFAPYYNECFELPTDTKIDWQP